MSVPAAVESAIKAQVDGMAAYRQALISAASARTPFWGLVDATGDQPYEDAVKGSSVTALDTVLTNVKIGNSSNIKTWFTLHNTYFSTEVDGATSFATGIATLGWRMSSEVQDFYFEANSQYLSPTLFFPSELITLASHVYTGDAFTAGTTISSTAYGPARVAMEATALIGASNYVVSVNCLNSDATTTAITGTMPSTSASGTEVVLGEEALTADFSAGSTTLNVAATAQFKVGEGVLVVDTVTGYEEVLTVQSIVDNTSLTFTSASLKSYLTANTATVTPLFFGVSSATTSSGTAGDTMNFRPKGDRTLTI